MTETPQEKPLYKRAPRGCGGIFFVFIVVAAALWGASLGFFVGLLDEAQSQIEVLEDFRPKVGSKVYSADGEFLGEFSYTTNYRQLVSLNEIPLYLQKAFLATEDHVFYEHHGVRPDAVIKAALRTLRSGHLYGGSTITQQIVRNLEPTQVGRERSIERKLKEMLYALQLERKYTKDEILELYLNQIFLGGSASGVEAAAHQYFGKRCQDLTLSEAAILAGLARAPNSNRPDRNPENALTRRDIVLQQMFESGFITADERDAAIAEEVDTITPEERLAMMATGEGFWGPNEFIAPYYVEEVRRRIMGAGPGQVSKQELLEGGLEVHTTLDLRLQRAAEDVLLTKLDEFDAMRLEQLKNQGREEDFIPVWGGLVCIDNRPGYEGAVRALVGGRDWQKSKFNTVTQALRQPGSSVKPFVWTAAIASGLTPSHMELDEPFVRIDPWTHKRWTPQNFDGTFDGPMTLRTALEKSRNIVSIKLVERLGLPLVKSYMVRAGIRKSEIPDEVKLTIALGTPVITILEQCTAYSTFAKNGYYAEPMFVREIRNPDGFVRFQGDVKMEDEPAIPPNVAYVVGYIMQGVAQWGTGARSRDLDRPRAGKTGTTNDNRDVWFCGFTPQYTCVVWLGYKDNRSLGRGSNYTGGRQACPVWTEFMVRAHKDLPVKDFDVPEGVVFYDVDKKSGLAGGSFREAFVEGTRPPMHPPIFPDADALEALMEDELLGGLDGGTSTRDDAPPALDDFDLLTPL